MGSNIRSLKEAARPAKSSPRHFFRPGGAGDRIIFGYMFRVIYSVAAVFSMAIFISVLIFVFGASLSNEMIVFFCGTSLVIMATGEALRRSVYETQSKREDSFLNRQDIQNGFSDVKIDESLVSNPISKMPLRSRVQKRAFDLFFVFISMVALSPLFLVTCCLIKFDSAGPIFSRQWRVGAQGRRFAIWKFRTMHADINLVSNRELGDVNESNLKLDARVTRVGKFLRRSSIDELPQLWNVFCGDMSIVGPRPLLYQKFEAVSEGSDSSGEVLYQYLDLKPGLTNASLFDAKAKLDSSYSVYYLDNWIKMRRDYIDNWSLIRDVRVIIRTFIALNERVD